MWVKDQDLAQLLTKQRADARRIDQLEKLNEQLQCELNQVLSLFGRLLYVPSTAICYCLNHSILCVPKERQENRSQQLLTKECSIKEQQLEREASELARSRQSNTMLHE